MQTLHARSNHLSLTEGLHLEASPSGSPAGSCATHRTPSVLTAPSEGIRWVMNPRYEYALPTGLALGQFSEASHTHCGSASESAHSASGSLCAAPLAPGAGPLSGGNDPAQGAAYPLQTVRAGRGHMQPLRAAAEGSVNAVRAGAALCCAGSAAAPEDGGSSGLLKLEIMAGVSGDVTAHGTVDSDTETAAAAAAAPPRSSEQRGPHAVGAASPREHAEALQRSASLRDLHTATQHSCECNHGSIRNVAVLV